MTSAEPPAGAPKSWTAPPVRLPEGLEVEGAILSDQIKSLDWRTRKAKKLCAAPAGVVEKTTAKILALVDPD
jgi:mRNA interferase MazF